MYCNNCRARGHLFRDCKADILSCGVILVLDASGGPQVLLVQRKHSIGYVEIMRGKYDLSNREYIETLWSGMSAAEQRQIQAWDFDRLWHDLWNGDTSRDRSEEKTTSRQKLSELLASLPSSVSVWTTPEWGIPKGRPMSHETDLACALRELHEEANVDTRRIAIVSAAPVFEERFQGSNGVWYKHRYFLAVPLEKLRLAVVTRTQRNEIGDIGWFSLLEARAVVRTPQRVQVMETALQWAAHWLVDGVNIHRQTMVVRAK